MGRPLCLIAKGGLKKPIIRHVPELSVKQLQLERYGWIVLVKESELPPVEHDDGA